MGEEYSEIFEIAKIVKHYSGHTKQDIPVSWDVLETVGDAITEGANHKLFRKFLLYFEGKEDLSDFFFVMDRFRSFLLIASVRCFGGKEISINDLNYNGFEECMDKLINDGKFKWSEH